MKVNSYNLIWIMIDSVRRYHTTGDDRSRIDFMDEFAKEGVEFLNCVTSAPSTLMSVSATLTSLPAYFLGRNYNEFQFDTDYFHSLTRILKSNNYKTDRAFIMHPLVRLKLKQFDLVPKILWPKHLSHSQWFNNDDINNMVHSVLRYEKKYKNKKPSFWFVDYNCRNDSNISNIVRNTVRSFEAAGYDETNTIFMISSDHGYPDPRRGITPETLKQKKITHDVFMTDDNIMIPLIIKYPGCKKGFKISNTISILDLLPTLLELMKIKVNDEISDNFYGISLVDLINGSNDLKFTNRKIRTDARLIDQPGRLTAVRGDKYKYIYDHDNDLEDFVYIGNNDNALIEKSYILSKNEDIIREIENFRQEFKTSEENAIKSFDNYNSYRLLKQIKIVLSEFKNLKILLIGSLSKNLLHSIILKLKSSLENCQIDVLLIDIDYNVDELDINNIIYLSNDEDELDCNNKLINYDFLVNISDKFENKKTKLFKSINNNFIYKNKLNLNTRSVNLKFNNSIHKKIHHLFDHFKIAFNNKHLYIEEPLLILKEPIILIRKMLKIEQKINGGHKKYIYKNRSFN